jgi:hypothetical protein
LARSRFYLQNRVVEWEVKVIPEPLPDQKTPHVTLRPP